MKEFWQRPNWHLSDWLALLTLFAIGLYVLVPSRMFLQPVSYALDGNTVRFVRTTPYGSVWADWTSEIRTIESPIVECHGSGTSFYQSVDDGAVIYQLGPYANPCIEAGAPFVIVQKWRVLLFGVIPLRPHVETYLID